MTSTTSSLLNTASLSAATDGTPVEGALDVDKPQNEVLANFFQSLLAARTGGGRREGGVQELAASSKAAASKTARIGDVKE